MTSQWLKTSDSRWLDFLSSLEHDVYHLPAYVALDCTRPGEEPVAYVYEDETGVFFQPLILRGVVGTDVRDASSPYGYPGPLMRVSDSRNANEFISTALSNMQAFLEEQGIVSLFVRMHPLLALPADPFRESGTVVIHGPTVSIDVTKSDEEMWSDLRQNHRRGINKAIRAGASFHHDRNWEAFESFIELYEVTMRRQNAADQYFFPRSYFEVLRDSLADSFQLLTVRLGNRVISAGIFSEAGGIVEYHLSGSDPDQLHLQPLKLLLNEAGKWARGRGNRLLHLGGGLGASEDSLYNFKLGFSKLITEFASWRMIANSAVYSDLVSRRGLNPESVDPSGYFPAYRRPND